MRDIVEFRVDQIDHVELFVPGRYKAAAWYEQVLGIRVIPEYEGWARDPGGPLMISSDGGSTKIALFRGTPQGDRPSTGIHRLTFRVNASGLMDFLQRLEVQKLDNHDDQRVTRDLVVDHQRSFSI